MKFHTTREQVTPMVSATDSPFMSIPPHVLDHARDLALSLGPEVLEKSPYVLGISSTLPGEGKTTVSFALADVTAMDFGLDVVLLDVHAERPWPRPSGELPKQFGLGDWLIGEGPLAEALVHVHDKFAIVPFGTTPLSSRDVLQHIFRARTFEMLRERYKLVIVDLPDLLNPTTAALARQCDGILLVIQAGVTPTDRVRAVLPTLQHVVIHGAVLNRHTSSVPSAIRRLFL